ncbi:MAG TPA: hypothetical protein PLG67_10970 [Bacillota bacterium]|nr:hypothetical protein [Bacillota bacterium]
MKSYFKKIRVSDRSVSMSTQILVSIGIIIGGFMLGLLQKWIDGSSNDILPVILQQLDIRNYFGRLAIWILLATIISVYAKTPFRASINTFLFFISMLAGYYLYCNYVLGFLPRTYMMIWVLISFASFFMAYICWYAKGEGIISIIISSVIIGVLFSQAFLITQGFYVTHLMEVVTWGIGIIILYRKPKQLAIELALSIVVAFVYQSVIPYFG